MIIISYSHKLQLIKLVWNFDTKGRVEFHKVVSNFLAYCNWMSDIHILEVYIGYYTGSYVEKFGYPLPCPTESVKLPQTTN